MGGEGDFAFVGMGIGEQDGIAMHTLDRHELVVVMAPNHPLMQMACGPITRLRGEPMIAVSSSGVNAPSAAASPGRLTKYSGGPTTAIREQPPDQLSAALAQSGG